MSKTTTPARAKTRRKTTRPAAAPAAPAKSTGGKIGLVVGLIQRSGGATLPELMAATGWQAHSVRGAIAGAIKKTLGLTVISTKSEAGRVYRIEATDDAA